MRKYKFKKHYNLYYIFLEEKRKTKMSASRLKRIRAAIRKRNF